MLTGVALLLTTALLWVGTGAVQGYAGRRKMNLILLQALAAAGSLIVFGLYGAFTGAWHSVHPSILIAMPLAGAINLFTMVLMAKSMEYGPNGIVWAMIQSALVMPFAMGVLFFGVPCPAPRLTGLITVVAAMLLMGAFGRDNDFRKSDRKWLWFTLASFITAGLSQCAANLPSYYLTGGEASQVTLPTRIVLSSLGAVGVFLLAAIVRRRTARGARACWKPAVWLILIGLISGPALYAGLDALARCGAGAVGYPLTLGASNILFLLFAIIFLKERPRAAAVFSMLLGVGGIVLMISPDFSQKTKQGVPSMDAPQRTTVIASPINFITSTYDRQKTVENLRKAGVTRVYLCGASPMNYDRELQKQRYAKLAEETKFYKEQGFEVWFWRWALWMDGNPPFTRAVSFRHESKTEMCPLDPAFQEFVREDLRMIARSGVDGMLYDDDFRFDNGNIGIGCLCDRHLKLAEAGLGRKIDRKNLEKEAFFGKPNPLRNALLAAWGESLNEFARLSRAAVDEINPEMRFGMCACLTSYDADGTTPAVLAKILAGKHRPYLRLIGAPYWASHWGFKIRLPEIIEYERMQNSFVPEEFEIFAEGDPWPRPRFNTPASHLEIFDSALRFADGFDGIQKYMFDYTSSAGYETGYLDMHLDHQDLYKAIARMTAGMKNAGIRVWQEQHTLVNADFSDIPDMTQYIDGPMLYPQAAWALAANGIPTVHRGEGCAAIVFGESARTLPESFRERPLILDIQAARLLTERGWQVGLQSSGARFKPGYEKFNDGELIQLRNRKNPGSRVVALSEGAEVLSRFPDNDMPASWRFRAPDGGNYLVFNFEGTVSDETSYRNYVRPKQIIDFIAACGSPLPAAVTSKNPDLYLQCKTGPGALAVGVWNCSPDYAGNLTVTLGDDYRKAEFAGCRGKLEGRQLVIERLDAFTFAAVKLVK